MSLIHELRGVESPIKPKHETEDNGYNPLFLRIIKRQGYYLVSDETLGLEKMECWRKEEIDFYSWLKENKLKIEEAKMNGYFKIYQ